MKAYDSDVELTSKSGQDKLTKQENLTDADKLLRDENKLLKTDLEEKECELDRVGVEMNRNVLVITQLRSLIATKETQLEDAFKKEKTLKVQLGMCEFYCDLFKIFYRNFDRSVDHKSNLKSSNRLS